MKWHVSLALFAVCLAAFGSGCHRAAQQTGGEPVLAEAKEQINQPKPPRYQFHTGWDENGSVEEVFDVCVAVFNEMKLLQDIRDVNDRMTFGRNARAFCDGLSADISTRAIVGININLQILKRTPETCSVTLELTSPRHSEDILQQQSAFIVQKIRNAR